MQIVRAKEPYVRADVEKDKKTMYIFTDNTDRDSGRALIPYNSWYIAKYGRKKHYPTVTSALIRGLHNAFPITTQRWYNKEHKGETGRWTDADFEEFKRVIDDDFEEIRKHIGNYDRVVFPMGGIFNSKIANISKERTPILYDYLMNKCKELL